MELESYAVTSRNFKPVQEVYIEKITYEAEHAPKEDLLKQLDQCIRALQHVKKGKRRATTNAKKTGTVQKKGVCWDCGLLGHNQRNCRKETTAVAACQSGNGDATRTGSRAHGAEVGLTLLLLVLVRPLT